MNGEILSELILVLKTTFPAQGGLHDPFERCATELGSDIHINRIVHVSYKVCFPNVL